MPRPAQEIDQTTFAGKISAEIRRRRLRKYPRVEDVAAVADVPFKSWYNWETGRPTIDCLPIVAQALGCTARALIPAN